LFSDFAKGVPRIGGKTSFVDRHRPLVDCPIYDVINIFQKMLTQQLVD